MLFALNENGDINTTGNAISDFVLSDALLSEYKLSKTILLTYFVFNHWLEKSFIKNKRNNYTKEKVKELIQNHLNEILKDKYDDLINKIDFTFDLQPKELILVFYLKQDKRSIVVLEKEIII